MSKLILIEGLDRVGKDTQISLLIKHFKDYVFQKLHYSALPFNNDVNQHTLYSKRLYDDMFKLLLSAKEKDINLILNRAHLGETVYSPLYRGYSGDYVFDIEKDYVNDLREDLYLITLVNYPHIVWSRDDGNSLSKTEEDIKAELDGFKRAHRLSKIKNKLFLNVGTSSADEISKIIIDFLSHTNSINGNLNTDL